jgi:hypothetical protein
MAKCECVDIIKLGISGVVDPALTILRSAPNSEGPGLKAMKASIG